MICVTRRYRFPAAHVLTQPAFSLEQNRRIFGRCANPAGHGHDYELEVSLTGPIDPGTGWIVAPELFDEILEQTIGEGYSHRMLNELAPFAALVPTAENIVRVLRDGLAEAVSRRSTARLVRVGVTETSRNRVEYGEIA